MDAWISDLEGTEERSWVYPESNRRASLSFRSMMTAPNVELGAEKKRIRSRGGKAKGGTGPASPAALPWHAHCRELWSRESEKVRLGLSAAVPSIKRGGHEVTGACHGEAIGEDGCVASKKRGVRGVLR